MSKIHPTAIIGPEVKLGNNVSVGAYAVLDGDITVGDDCIIGPYVHTDGWVRIGRGTKIFMSCSIGEAPQDYSWDGQKGLVEIGEDCIIREFVTVHTPVRGAEGLKTSIGNHVFLMATSHVAHNVQIGDHSVVANGTLLAGFVIVEDNVFLSGNIGVHQNCRIGAYSIVGAVAKVAQDIPPFTMADGHPAETHGLNVVGLRRKGINQEERNRLKDAYKILYSGKGIRDAVADIEAKYPSDPLVSRLTTFVKATKRGIASHAASGNED